MLEPHPPADRFEFWVRFVCGALLGVVVGSAALSGSFMTSWVDWLTLAGVTVLSGLLAGWFGDRFWYAVLRWFPWW